MKAIKKEVNNPCEVIDIDCRYACDVIKAVPELGYIERGTYGKQHSFACG